MSKSDAGNSKLSDAIKSVSTNSKSSEVSKLDTASSNVSEAERLEWIETFQQINEMRKNEGGLREKMIFKIKENPFVPIGILATTTALTLGILSMRSGNKRRSQLLMRARVLSQGFTVAAILIGIAVAAKTKPSES